MKGHWFLRDRPRGQWYPDAVGIVPGYPLTRESWLVRQANGVKNPHQGRQGRLPRYAWKGTPEGLAERRREARAYAARKVKQMAIKFDDPRAEQAMEALIGVIALKDVEGKHLNSTKDVISASTVILNFTQAKPVEKKEHVVRTAEDWLESLDQ